jgi:hypothetical protein
MKLPQPLPTFKTPLMEYATKADVAAIRGAIVEVVADDPPMTVRQVFYQLVTRGVIEKSEIEYHRTVIRLMTEMRLAGDLPYDWIIDESRRVRVTRTYDSVADAIEQTARFLAIRARTVIRLPGSLAREGRAGRRPMGRNLGL